MALMLSFLHDHALAANPWNIIGGIFRLGGVYFLLCLFVTAALAVAVGACAAALLVRTEHVGIYIVLALGCWVVVQWTSIVVMRVMGLCCYQHRDALQWHHERPRWGVTWRL